MYRRDFQRFRFELAESPPILEQILQGSDPKQCANKMRSLLLLLKLQLGLFFRVCVGGASIALTPPRFGYGWRRSLTDVMY
jgi:hypothetical protein